MSALQPGVYDGVGRAALTPSADLGRQAMYREPDEASMSARFSRNIQPQSYEQPLDPGEAGIASPGDVQNNAPAIAWNGYCPVELIRRGRWVEGDPRWTVVYGGLIYRFLLGDARQPAGFSRRSRKVICRPTAESIRCSRPPSAETCPAKCE